MELCEQSLNSFIQERNANDNSLSLDIVHTIARQISKGLEYLHDSNVLHHDINVSFKNI